jgi:FkbM family methyltransferase
MLIPFDKLFSKHNIRSKDVLHLGANTGQEAEEYYAHGIDTVVWVEAHHSTFLKLVGHVRPYPNHICLEACVGDVDGKEVTFHVANNGCQSSSILEFGTHKREHPTVSFIQDVRMVTRRVDTLMSENKITFKEGGFLNIDLQGAELLALKGMGKLIDCFDHIYVEVNEEELYKGCALVSEVDHFLARQGFVGKDCHMTKSGWGDKYYQKVWD